MCAEEDKQRAMSKIDIMREQVARFYLEPKTPKLSILLHQTWHDLYEINKEINSTNPEKWHKDD